MGVYTSSLQSVVEAAAGVAGRGVDSPPMLLCGERGSPYLRKPSGKEMQVWQQWGGPAQMLSTV